MLKIVPFTSLSSCYNLAGTMDKTLNVRHENKEIICGAKKKFFE